MNDIITAENLPLVIGAIFTGLAGLAAWRHGGKLGDEAKHLSPPSNGTATVGGLALTNDGVKQLADPLTQIAKVLTEWWEFTKRYRESRTEETLQRTDETLDEVVERLRTITDPVVVEAIRAAAAARQRPPKPPSR